jgi:DNA topoisomerase-1
MKYSTLTKPDLERAYDRLSPTLDFNLVNAGKTRHEIDWLFGINLSRALTRAARRATGRYVGLSTGRVQGPALRFLVKRENRISCFVPTPFWAVKAEFQIKGESHKAQCEKSRLESEAEAAAVVEKCRGKSGRVEAVEERDFTQSPPIPFDLSTLQDEAYRLFGYYPRRTAKIAERLYLEALISYPRTDSQKLPPTIGYKEILAKMQECPAYSNLIPRLLMSRLTPNEGEKEDPAHPAVYPTGTLPNPRLSASSRRLWDLIARRFMATFGEPAEIRTTRVTVDLGGTRFFLIGHRSVREGWARFYRPHILTKHKPLPEVKEGKRLRTTSVSSEAKFTKPPPRFNPSSLLKRMEREGIGTKGTRTEIIQTLYDRKFVQGRRMRVTDIGRAVLEVLEEYAPSITSVSLTRTLQEKVELIKAGREASDAVLEEAIIQLKNTVGKMKKSEAKIANVLARSLEQSRTEVRSVGECPECRSGNLVILRSRKSGKRFVGCTNYFDGKCRASFPLPQKGTVKPSENTCSTCGIPIVLIQTSGRRAWRLCLNPACPSKKRERQLESHKLQQA